MKNVKPAAIVKIGSLVAATMMILCGLWSIFPGGPLAAIIGAFSVGFGIYTAWCALQLMDGDEMTEAINEVFEDEEGPILELAMDDEAAEDIPEESRREDPDGSGLCGDSDNSGSVGEGDAGGDGAD